jgi:hypothetical protein
VSEKLNAKRGTVARSCGEEIENRRPGKETKRLKQWECIVIVKSRINLGTHSQSWDFKGKAGITVAEERRRLRTAFGEKGLA